MSIPVTVRFRAAEFGANSQREGYLWLLNRFATLMPNPAQYFLDHAGNSPVRRYFAESREQLFRRKPKHELRAADFGTLACGCFVNVVLNNEEKVAVLGHIARALGLRRGMDWDWSVERRANSRRARVIPTIYFLE